MSEEIDRTGLPAIYSKDLIDIAEQAEKRIEAIIKIKKVALKVTNKFDWTNQQDRPYLQVSGSEKIANLFNISWRIDEPRLEFEEDGHFTYTFKGEFSLAGRTIEVEGSRSSKDPFFKKYDYNKDDQGKTTKTEKPISAIDKRDVKMAALTNLLGNGISRILGIRNLQWSDLEEFAGIKKEEVNEIQYKKGGDRTPLKEPQKKTEGKATEGTPASQVIVSDILRVETVEYPKKGKEGKPTGEKGKFYKIYIHDGNGNEAALSTFSESLFAQADKEKGTGLRFKIEWKSGRAPGVMELVSLEPFEPEPGSEENAQ